MIGLDYETAGARNLPEVGLDNYISDPKFRVLIAAWATVEEGEYVTHAVDFVNDPDAQAKLEAVLANHDVVAAHNATFEQCVSERIDLQRPFHQEFLDTAMLARAMGADSHLEKAVLQLLDNQVKMPEGKDLIRKFSLPREDGTFLVDEMHAAGTLEGDVSWWTFIAYCCKDAELSLRLANLADGYVPTREWGFSQLTHDMNQTGWKVDLDLVNQMQGVFEENLQAEEKRFRDVFGKDTPNFRSTPQLTAWCAKRGIRATSFDEMHVTKLIAQVKGKLEMLSRSDRKYTDYYEVFILLRTKQALGGSSLTKLKKILELTGEDSILRNQYLHLGAGQTYRTSGRGVQLQNLKRLGDIEDVNTIGVEFWSNDMLARNIRQCFTARDPDGSLIVGDFSSVESRGLAYLAGANWKLTAFRQGQDLYKVQAASIYHTGYDEVTKPQRQVGKVGELSCGYGAGPEAVQSFAEKMGVVMSLGESTDLVSAWRKTNPEIVALWHTLDEMLGEAIDTNESVRMLPHGMRLIISTLLQPTPASLLRVHPGAKTLTVSLADPDGHVLLRRVFQGVYRRGNSLCYYRPSALASKTWEAFFVDPKTKQRRFYSVYGGKLTGIITQSLCRELFFDCLYQADKWVARWPESLKLVGQFHDEIVVDFTPGGVMSVEAAEVQLATLMSTCKLPGFPLTAEVKRGYRYIK